MSFSRAGFEIFNKDCFEHLAAMEDQSVDVSITDVPYSETTHKGARTNQGDKKEIRKLVEFDHISGKTYLRICKQLLRVTRRWVIVFCDWHHMALLEPADLPLVRFGIWVKLNPSPQFTGDRPGHAWEAIAILHNEGKKQWNGGGDKGAWISNRVNAKWHPTQKPLKLMRELVRLFSNKRETIFDPFMGSGTTGVAALQLERKFIGIEKDEAYYKVAETRLEHTTPKAGFGL
jgi:site-specific DNA-methyltransferase (adenine-specific)